MVPKLPKGSSAKGSDYGNNSDWGKVNTGIPQGSVLWTLLFLININNQLKLLGLGPFADDTCLLIEIDYNVNSKTTQK